MSDEQGRHTIECGWCKGEGIDNQHICFRCDGKGFITEGENE